MSDQPQSENESDEYHIPVLLQQCIEGLNIQQDGTYVDCTFGGGGHSKSILSQLSPTGKLFVFDQDQDARVNAPADDRLVFIPQNFRHLYKFLRLHDALPVQGILADLGISSHQIDVPERGFSTRYDAGLDMRMDQSQSNTAADVLNKYSEAQLHKIFERYGSVTNAKSLAAFIVAQRLKTKFTSINAFKHTIYDYVKGNPHKYLAQVFQALRMEVNEEEITLKELLNQTTKCLAPGGRLVIITFHSVEDRLVKNFIKTGTTEEQEGDENDLYGRKIDRPFIAINKKPIVATDAEQRINPRSRSAKLRVAEKK